MPSRAEGTSSTALQEATISPSDEYDHSITRPSDYSNIAAATKMLLHSKVVVGSVLKIRVAVVVCAIT
jgi:hypothetical protein